jgi:hypothetical protein
MRFNLQVFDPKVYPSLAALDEKVRALLLSDRAKGWDTPRTQFEIAKIHPVFWMEEYGFIRPDRRELGSEESNVVGGVVPFRLNTVQLKIADKICAHFVGPTFTRVQMTILKHRKAGVSTLIAAFDYWHMRFYENLNAFVIADLSSHSSNITEMIKTFKDKDTCGAGDPIPSHNPPRAVPMPKNKNGLRMNNGSMLEQDTGENDNPGTSATITVCHMSENSKWRAPEDAETSLLNSIPRTGYAFVIKESTAFGINKYAKDCQEAEEGKSSWEFVFITWLDMTDCEDPMFLGESLELDQDEKELMASYPKMREGHVKFRRRQIELLGDASKFRQDFPLNSREPFLITGSNFFNTALIEKRINDIKFFKAWKVKGLENIGTEFPDVVMRLKHNPRGIRAALITLEEECVMPSTVQINETDMGVSYIKSELAKCEDGAATLFRAPRPGRKYLVVVDVAEGKRSKEYVSDNSIIDVYDIEMREQVMQWGGTFDEEITAMYAIRIAKMYNMAVIVPEMNNKCGGLLWGFLDKTYRNMYYRETIQSNATKKEPGWHTSTGLKQDVCGQLRLDFKNGDCLLHSMTTLEEMLYFVDKQGKLEAAEGHNDDRVMTAAIAMKVIAVTPKLRNQEKRTALIGDITQCTGSPQFSRRADKIRRFM